MDFSRILVNDVTVLELKGMSQFGDSRHIKEELDEIRKTCIKLVVDFSGVEYVGSSVLGVLATEVRKNRELGGDVKLVNLTAGIKRLFSITRLDKVFNIYDDRETALNDFSS